MKDIIKKRIEIKKIIFIIFALTVCGLIYFFVFKGKEAPLFQYETTKIVKKDIVSKVMATGTLSALVTVEVGSQVSGRLQKIMVDYNSKVHKGQILAQIDTSMFKAAVDQAKANLLAATSTLNKTRIQADDAQRLWERNSMLLEKNLISQAEVDTAKSSMDMAKAEILAAEGGLAQAEASLQQAQITLGYTTIYSPINGIVISRSVDQGQTVAASFQAPTLFTIAEDLIHMQVDTSVSEADVGKLTPEMEATFTVDAYPGELFVGKVRQIRNEAQTVQNVVTYDAVIDVENPELKLKPGMTANVNFIFARKEGALAVTNSALRFKPPVNSPEFKVPPENTGRAIWVFRNGKPQRIKVVTGISDGISTEIISGEIIPGDEAVTEIKTGETKSGGFIMRGPH